MGRSVGSNFKVAVSLFTLVRATASEITTGLGEKIVLATTRGLDTQTLMELIRAWTV